MKHYPHHISDFNNATRHLTRLERGLYRDLIDLYYETEAQLPLELQTLCRKIVANELSTDVERLLNEFFVKTPKGWFHERCEEEISNYQANNSQRALAGKASAAKKALKKQQALNGNLTSVETPLNDSLTEMHNQSTNQPINHKPIKEKSARAPTIQKPDDVGEQVWVDWLHLRKAKRAPVTETALRDARHQSELANMGLESFLAKWCARGSQSLEAAWLKQHERGSAPASTHKYAAAAHTIFGKDNDEMRTVNA